MQNLLAVYTIPLFLFGGGEALTCYSCTDKIGTFKGIESKTCDSEPNTKVCDPNHVCQTMSVSFTHKGTEGGASAIVYDCLLDTGKAGLDNMEKFSCGVDIQLLQSRC